jgi:hypothetical protein
VAEATAAVRQAVRAGDWVRARAAVVALRYWTSLHTAIIDWEPRLP